jgi:hypothetical protein
MLGYAYTVCTTCQEIREIPRKSLSKDDTKRKKNPTFPFMQAFKVRGRKENQK